MVGHHNIAVQNPNDITTNDNHHEGLAHVARWLIIPETCNPWRWLYKYCQQLYRTSKKANYSFFPLNLFHSCASSSYTLHLLCPSLPLPSTPPREDCHQPDPEVDHLLDRTRTRSDFTPCHGRRVRHKQEFGGLFNGGFGLLSSSSTIREIVWVWIIYFGNHISGDGKRWHKSSWSLGMWLYI